MRFASRENISASLASLTSLARREKCNILSSLRFSQFVSLAFARLTNQQSHNSQREISVRLKILARFSQDSRVKISNDSHESRYEISVCETRESRYKICLRDSREASLATKFRSARFVRSDTRYEISKRDSLFAILATKFLSVRLTRSESRY
jgi:hypothetical protein